MADRTDLTPTAQTPGAVPAAALTAPSPAEAALLPGSRSTAPAPLAARDEAPDASGREPAAWPADWRDLLAAGDDKTRRRLERFSDPNAVWTSYTQLEAKLRAGGATAPHPPAPPEGASTEEVATWRKAHGVPATPDGYLAMLPAGLVIGGDDRPMMKEFFVVAHRLHAPSAIVARMVDWYYRTQETIAAEQLAKDGVAKEAAERALRAEWGAQYRRNLNLVSGYHATAPASVKTALMHGRTLDGRLLAAMPEMAAWLLDLALDANPVATVAPGAGASAGAGLQARKAAIEQMMRENRRAYDRDPKVQQEYRELIEAEQRVRR